MVFHRVHYGELVRGTQLADKFPFETDGLVAEWAVLLECVSPNCDPQRLSGLLRRKPDWSVLLPLAEEHGVLGLLAGRLQSCGATSVTEGVCQKLREKQRALLLFTLSTTAELFRLLESFSAASMEALVVKGPALSARAYGDPGARQYEDVDLLVRQRDISRFTELMTSEGYEPKVPLSAIAAGKIPGEYLFRWPHTYRRVELHTEQTLRYFPRPLPVEKFFERKSFVSFDAHAAPALSAEDELLLDCIHGAKHFWERLLWVADVAALVCREKGLDWDRAFSTAREAGAGRMLSLGLLLAAEVFQVKLPGEVEKVVRSDRGAARLAAEIARRLPPAGYTPRTLLERALFRMRMRGGLLPGAAYLLRLTFSPTEEDWAKNNRGKRPRLFDALQRPVRLARKYWHGGNE
ncbi:MAG TPA: nucleotidyltransferase family protein [Candidatus Acidoferrales bacterium]|nr:nucleotidyltransferase family protein [Candidatus Acidoferrales bacterium]